MQMKKWISFTVCLILSAALFLSACADVEVHFNETPPDDWQSRNLLRLSMFNTTNNDAMLLECGGECMIIDGGNKSFAKRLLNAYREMGHVNENGDVYVNRIFNTHPHDDHMDGIINMLENGLCADEFMTSFPSNYKAKDSKQQELLKAVEKRGIPIHYIQQFEEIKMGDAVLVFFWYAGGKTTNQLSCCTYVTFGDATMLLTGDLVNAAQRGVLREVSTDYLKADVMKMPHHGMNICDKSFLDAVQPKLVFVTARQQGVPKLLQQMTARGIPLVRHSIGRIVLETDGTVWYVNQLRDVF